MDTNYGNELLWQILRGLPGAYLRMILANPVPWLVLLGMLVLMAWLGRLDKRLARRERQSRRRR